MAERHPVEPKPLYDPLRRVKDALLADIAAAAGSATWGDILGALADQVDLQAALDAKLSIAAYTAADVLAKLLTADGTGSGLDADLLDGQQGAYYLSRTNHTGTQLAATISNFSAAADARITAAIGVTAQAHDADLLSWAGVTRASGFDTFAAMPSSANLAALVTGETGSGALVFGTGPSLSAVAALGVAANTTVSIAAPTGGGVSRFRATLAGGGDNFDIGTTGPSWSTLFTWWTASINFIYAPGGLKIGGPSANWVELQNNRILINGVQVLTTRKTGWTAPTGTATRTTYDTATVTLPQLAERMKGLVDDLIAHGLIGA